jgi:pyrimidine-specific ribonucleoside hydrolase
MTTRGHRLVALLAALATPVALVAGCATDAGSGQNAEAGDTAAPSRTAVVVDTDAGLDDAIALLYLARSPEVELVAVTVSGTGLAHCHPGALNVIGLLELAGRPDVPVACGSEEPLGPAGYAFPEEWRRFTDGRYDDAWRIGRGSVDRRPAAQLLVDTIGATGDAGRPVTLVTLGPLTNVAEALTLDSELADGLERVVAMAGAFDVAGNVEAAEPPPPRNVAEWNVYADARAARTVVHAGLPMTFVPLDATSSVPLDVYFLRATARAPRSPTLDVVHDLLSRMHGSIIAGDYYLWDPLAAVLTLHPELGTAEVRTMDVVIDGPETGRTNDAPSGTSVDVFTAADGRAAEAQLVEVLAGAAIPEIAAQADLVIDPVACTSSGTSISAGPQVVELQRDDVAPDLVVAVGVLDPDRSVEDIEEFLAAPTPEGPDWFTPTAMLSAAPGAASADVADLVAGTTYTIVCLRGDWGQMELAGIESFTVPG